MAGKKKSKKLPFIEQFRHLKEYLMLAGIKQNPTKMFVILLSISGFIDLSLFGFLAYKVWEYELKWVFILVLALVLFTLGYLLIFFLVWLIFLFMIDYLKFKRRIALEEILPEFLRLVSSNHRAGLPLDTSLWKANRPRFGILAQEINDVAKNTYATGDLIKSLENLGVKYDSNMLKRVISNIVEGIKTGADIATLLDDVSSNITTIKNTRKELASEVENYMLFITVTVLVISPLMFGLTHKMSGLIESVKSTLAETMGSQDPQTTSQMPMSLNFSEEGGRGFKFYFDLFVFLMIATNSIISVLLMSMVKHGNVKQDLKRIPVYYTIAVIVYIACKALFANFIVI
ncbi:hypothetical protein GF323_06145 [Candidatus Woesearchaeota archaeon]|nr:hypothetical protein [Candidatus Woesearchaeota archaeon]